MNSKKSSNIFVLTFLPKITFPKNRKIEIVGHVTINFLPIRHISNDLNNMRLP